jgi:FHS family glucose/mannose:H+ symporter-like MFS transporter
MACLSLVYLAIIPVADADLWRAAGFFLLGASISPLNACLMHAITPLYTRDPAATLNLAGAFLGLGSVVSALLVAATFFAYPVARILLLLALLPALLRTVFARTRFDRLPLPPPVPLRKVWEDVRSPEAVMLGLLLFFQSGNEWSIAGWLPLFLIQRLGVSPAAALHLLAVYWLALLVGRVVMQAVLPTVRHGFLLTACGASAVLGCGVLFYTNNLFGAWAGILFLGLAYSAIYPLVTEKIGGRFPDYHPGFFNGIFSLAAVGGLLAPCTLGLYAALWGIRAVMLIPFLGSVAVFLLVVVIRVYARLTSPPAAREARG